MPAQLISLSEAAERFGVPVVRLGRWCATGKIRCERDEDGWLIPVSEGAAIAQLYRDYATEADGTSLRALAVPAPSAPKDLALQVSARLGLEDGAVSLTPLALDGVEYVVAVWRGEMRSDGGLPALQELAGELDAELLD
jgi:hypothetical protein